MSGLTEERPAEAQHYETLAEVPHELTKYWHQRYSLFSKYDESGGIWMTPASWYGVTPEPVANAVAEHIAEAAPASKTILIDAFAGIGGNTIAFARSGRWDRIFAIERDDATLQCAKHNAKVYGVEKKIWWVKGDCFNVIKKQYKTLGKQAVIFGSPPWGGPGYREDEVFKLATMQPYGLRKLYDEFSKVTKDLVLYLPRTSDLNEIAALAEEEKQVPVTHYCMKGASKAICAYFGDFDLEPTQS